MLTQLTANILKCNTEESDAKWMKYSCTQTQLNQSNKLLNLIEFCVRFFL